MLVESGSGKSGRAFEYVMEAPEEGDFVLIGNNGHVVTRKGPPRRLSVGLDLSRTTTHPFFRPLTFPSALPPTPVPLLCTTEHPSSSIHQVSTPITPWEHTHPTHTVHVGVGVGSLNFLTTPSETQHEQYVCHQSLTVQSSPSRRWPRASCASHCTYISPIILPALDTARPKAVLVPTSHTTSRSTESEHRVESTSAQRVPYTLAYPPRRSLRNTAYSWG